MSRQRRELTVAVLGIALAGGLALVAGGQAWATVEVERAAPLPPVSGVVTGAAAAPLVPAAGLLLLAAAVALLAVRGAGRVGIGLVVAAAGSVLVWSGVQVLGGELDAATPDLPSGGQGGAATVDLAAAWPVLTVLAGALGAAAGGLVMMRGGTWPGMGRRYERAGQEDGRPATARPQSDEDRAQAAWRALDRGEDPTA